MKARARFESVHERLVRRLALGVALASAACGPAMGEDGQPEPDPTALTEEIRSGTLTQKRGVIQLRLDGSDRDHICTGAMISQKHAITAAHCLKTVLGSAKSGWFRAWLRYYDPLLPTGTYRWVTSSFDDGEPSEWFWGDIHDDFAGEGDWEDDLGLLRRFNGTFPGTTTNDYLRLGQGSCSQIDRNERFGAGAKGFSGEIDNLLRKSPVNVYSCFLEEFFDLSGGDQTCGGDSGAPHINLAGSFDVITGVFSGNSPGNNVCAESNTEQWSMRMNSDKIDWLSGKMDITCWHYDQSGYIYRRCW